MRNVKKTSLFLVLLLIAPGCASTHMKQYLGQDIREVVLDSGPPVNAFDLEEGRRAFQYYWGGGSIYVPQTTSYNATTQVIGSTAWTTGTAITSGGYVLNNPGCLISYIADWDEYKKAWVVNDINYPKGLFC